MGHRLFNSGTTIRCYLVEQGFIVVSIGYRLAPTHPWPAQLHCQAAAFRWIKANYGKHPALPIGDKPSGTCPMLMIGASAGAHVSLCFNLIAALIRCGRGDVLPSALRDPVKAALTENAFPQVQSKPAVSNDQPQLVCHSLTHVCTSALM